MSIASRLLKDSLLYSLASVLTRSTQLVLLPLYARCLGDGDLGRIDLLTGFSLLVMGLLGLNVTNGMGREMAEVADGAEKRRHTASAFWFSAVLFAGWLLVTWLCASWMAGWVLNNPSLAEVLVLTGGYIFVAQLMDVALNHFRWTLQPGRSVILSFINALGLIGGAILFVGILRWGLFGAVCAMIMGALCCLIGSVSFDFRAFLPRIDPSVLGRMLRFAIPLVPSSVGVLVATYVGRFAVSDNLPGSDLDALTVVTRIGSILVPLLGGINQSLIPLIYQHHHESGTPLQLAGIFRWFCGVSVVLVSGLALIAPWVILLLSKSTFLVAAPLVGVMALALLLNQCAAFFPGAWIHKRTGVVALINVGLAGLNLALSYWLVPLLGLWGAVAAGVAAQFLGLAMVAWFSCSFYPAPYDWPRIFMALGVVAGACVIAALLPISLGWGDGLMRFAVLVGVALSVVAFGIVTRAELGAMRLRIATRLIRFRNRATDGP
jgi:O-antigen/teichoic acid export membrane protein